MSTKLDEALDLLAKAEDLETKARKLGEEHAREFAPYKPGDRVYAMQWAPVSIQGLLKQGENAVVTKVSFNPRSAFEMKCVIHVQPYTKTWLPHARKNGWIVFAPAAICKIDDLPEYLPATPLNLNL